MGQFSGVIVLGSRTKPLPRPPGDRTWAGQGPDPGRPGRSCRRRLLPAAPRALWWTTWCRPGATPWRGPRSGPEQPAAQPLEAGVGIRTHDPSLFTGSRSYVRATYVPRRIQPGWSDDTRRRAAILVKWKALIRGRSHARCYGVYPMESRQESVAGNFVPLDRNFPTNARARYGLTRATSASREASFC